MTDLAARLRDVLTAKSFAQIVTDDPWTSELIEAPVDAIATALLPLWSSLLEEREREIRRIQSRIKSIKGCGSRLRHKCSVCDGQFVVIEESLSRLAASSSPAEEK